jgi:hypothetical protein
MLPETVLQIILNGELILLEFLKHMPPEQWAAMWDDHQKFRTFWRTVYERLSKGIA